MPNKKTDDSGIKPTNQINNSLHDPLYNKSIDSIKELLSQQSAKERIKSIHRSELLPYLFRFQNKPFSLEKYPQLKPLYDNTYVPNTVFICGRQLGKTINLSRSEVLDLISIPHFRILYVAPLEQQTQRYSLLYLEEAIKSCSIAKQLCNKELEGKLSDARIVQNVQYKSFANGSNIILTYAKTSSDRARGLPADRIDFDEIQDQLVDNINIISESLTASKYGVRLFTGTAKTTDNTIEHLWQQSTQSEWVMKCEGCGYWNIPNEEGKILNMIQADGIHCVNCGKRLNTRNGEWVAAYPDRQTQFRGYHIPQIIVPAIVENYNNWRKVLYKVLHYPISAIMQEVLGISYSLGARLITQKDIDKQSILPTTAKLQEQLSQYAFTVGGVDWGGAEHTSFTVHTVIGIKPTGTIDVIWARRFAGFDPDTTLSEIAKAHRFYKCHMLAADYGMGFDKNVMLENRFGISVIQIMLASQKQLMSYSPTQGHHRWILDKTMALELLFLAIKYGRIFFPPQEEFKIYTDDLLSPFEEVVDRGGLTYRYFSRNPNRPDDFCMALCFACVLGMHLINSTLIDLVPAGAFNPETISGVPTNIPIDPSEMMNIQL